LRDAEDTLHAERIRDAVLRIRDYTQGLDQAAFVAQSLISDAVSMNLLAIGENASKLSATARALTPEIEWRDAINLRHRIAHGYEDLSLSILWSIVVVELDTLQSAAERIVAARP
jgi:uncharacterized protein with HEPN domain